jgi:hypothetical protein
MPSPLTDISNPLDAATTASLHARRERLQRRVRNQRIRTRIALGLSGCIAIFGIAAYLIRDYPAARSCAMMACVVFAFTLIGGAAARKKAVEALREIDRPA